MGGYGSGRQYGRPIVDNALRVDIGWMIRTGRAVLGARVGGTLGWTCRGEPSGAISYICDMTDPDDASMTLRFTVTNRATSERHDYAQHVPFSYTVPNYGGRRWWMHCPMTGERVGKLYCPNGAEKFASRKAYRLGYRSQRVNRRDQIFEALFKVQRQLGGEIGWGQYPLRPKGMWHTTYARHIERYYQLDKICNSHARALVETINQRAR